MKNIYYLIGGSQFDLFSIGEIVESLLLDTTTVVKMRHSIFFNNIYIQKEI